MTSTIYGIGNIRLPAGMKLYHLPADIVVSFIGQPTASQRLCRLVIGRPLTLAANLPLSTITCRVAPAASWTVTFTRNGTTIGTGTIALGATTGTFTFTSAVTLVSGDILEMDAPVAPDSALQDPSITLAGIR